MMPILLIFLKFIICFMIIGNSFTIFVIISTHIIIVHRQLYIAKALLKNNLLLYIF